MRHLERENEIPMLLWDGNSSNSGIKKKFFFHMKKIKWKIPFFDVILNFKPFFLITEKFDMKFLSRVCVHDIKNSFIHFFNLNSPELLLRTCCLYVKSLHWNFEQYQIEMSTQSVFQLCLDYHYSIQSIRILLRHKNKWKRRRWWWSIKANSWQEFSLLPQR